IHSESGLDTLGQRPEIAHPLQLVVRQLHLKMVLQAGEQFQSLQAVNAQLLEEVVVGRQLFPRHFEVSGRQDQNFVESLLGSAHHSFSFSMAAVSASVQVVSTS